MLVGSVETGIRWTGVWGESAEGVVLVLRPSFLLFMWGVFPGSTVCSLAYEADTLLLSGGGNTRAILTVGAGATTRLGRATAIRASAMVSAICEENFRTQFLLLFIHVY